MEAKVLMPFYDVKAGVDRKVGDVIDVTNERFDEINEKLGEALLFVGRGSKPEPEAFENEHEVPTGPDIGSAARPRRRKRQ